MNWVTQIVYVYTMLSPNNICILKSLLKLVKFCTYLYSFSGKLKLIVINYINRLI